MDRKVEFVLLILFFNPIRINCCHPRGAFPGGANNIQFAPFAFGTPFGSSSYPRPIIFPQSQWPFFNNPFLGLTPAQLATMVAANPSFWNNPFFLQAFLPSLTTFQLSSMLAQTPGLVQNPQFAFSLVSSLSPAQLGALINANPNLLTYPTFIPALSSLPSSQLFALLNSGTLNPQLATQLAANPSIQRTIAQNTGNSNSVVQSNGGSAVQSPPMAPQQQTQQQVQPGGGGNGGGDSGIQRE